MDTRKRTNAEFQQETEDRLARHESLIERILTELQALNASMQPMREQNLSGSLGPSLDGGKVVTTTQKPYLKLMFPRFSGEEPAGWLYQAEQYFAFQRVEEGDKVHLASFHLDGIALQWHRWLEKSKGPMSWLEFSKAVHSRFGPTDYEDPAEALSRLKQTSTVVAYQEAFERLSHRVDGLPEPFLIGCFIGGLKDEIRLEVKLKAPRSLSEAIGMARLVEKKVKLDQNHESVEGAPVTGLLGPAPNNRVALPAPNSVRRLSSAELRDRHVKGLCYYCDEIYRPGHKCSKPQLFMILDSSEDTGHHLEDKVDLSGVD